MLPEVHSAVDPGGTDGPTGIAAGDFNGDGKIDIVYIDSRSYTIGSTIGQRSGVRVASER